MSHLYTILYSTMRKMPTKSAKCLNCGKNFVSSFRNRNNRGMSWKLYCSNKCRGVAAAPKGKRHYLWMGDNVKYVALHDWVRRTKPIPSSCTHCCKESKLQAANISGEYRRDITDWVYLCCKCHRIMDGILSRRSTDGTFAANPDRNPFVPYPRSYLKKLESNVSFSSSLLN